MFEQAFCVLRIRKGLSFYVGRLYLMIHVSSGNGKGVLFSVLIAL